MAKTSFKSVTYFPIKIKPWLRNPVKYENPARKVPATSKGWVKWHNCVEKNLLLCPHADHLITNPRQINLHMNTVSFKSVTYFSVKMKPWLRNPDYSFIMLLQFRLFLKICKAVFLHWKKLLDKQNVYYENSWRQCVESILQKHSETRAQRWVTIAVSKLFSSVLFNIFFVINTGKYL